MISIPFNLLIKYYMASKEEDSTFEDSFNRYGDEREFINVFLQQTDYIPNKIIEAQFLGDSLDKDYTDIVQLRKQCRQRLNELSAEE